MRVIILAMDGLEYDFVLKWRLKALIQKVCGYVDVSEYYIDEVGDILTTAVWASFITGKSLKEHGIRRLWVSRYKFIEDLRLKRDRIILYKLLRPVISAIARKLRIVEPPTKRYLVRKGLTTIFDEYPSFVIEFPSYNESINTRNKLIKASRKGLDSYIKEVWNINRERIEGLIDALHNDNYAIYAVWLDIADKVGHVYLPRKRILEVMKAYFWLNKVAYQISKILKDEDFMLIISDHGMNLDGTHSPRAFYSFSRNINLKPGRITEFKCILEKVINEVR